MNTSLAQIGSIDSAIVAYLSKHETNYPTSFLELKEEVESGICTTYEWKLYSFICSKLG